MTPIVNRVINRCSSATGETWVRRYTAMFDAYIKETVHEAGDQLMNEGCTIDKYGDNFLSARDSNNRQVSIIFTPAGWGKVKVSARRDRDSQEDRLDLSGTDPKMLAGHAVYKMGLF